MNDALFKAWDHRYRLLDEAGVHTCGPFAPDTTLREFLENADVPMKGRALDLGCGEGRHAAALVDWGFQVRAVDFSERALMRAQKLVKRPRRMLTFDLQDFRDAEALGENAFDIVLHGNTLEYLLDDDERGHAVATCFRALRKGGWVLCSQRGGVADLRGTESGARRWYEDRAAAGEHERLTIRDAQGSRSFDAPFIPARWTTEQSAAALFEHAGFRVARVLAGVETLPGSEPHVVLWAQRPKRG